VGFRLLVFRCLSLVGIVVQCVVVDLVDSGMEFFVRIDGCWWELMCFVLLCWWGL